MSHQLHDTLRKKHDYQFPANITRYFSKDVKQITGYIKSLKRIKMNEATKLPDTCLPTCCNKPEVGSTERKINN